MARFKTKLTEALGIEHPIIQGGMHFVGYAEMAAAVSNAGGLGIITALTVALPPNGAENLRKEIRKCKTLTDKPFGVNITLLPVGVQPDFEGIVKVIIEEGVKVVETAGRNPEVVIKPLKAAGIFVIHKCVAVRHAIKAAKLGADMISMDGFDCGGHPGEEDVGNWVLAPIAAKKLTIPFVVSGGCADGKQLAAALAMGAEGINMGTAFMATTEAPLRQEIKDAIVKASERDTTHIFRTLNNTERVFKNATAMKVREIEFANPGDFSKIAPYVKGENYRKSFQETGDTESSVWSCGQSIGLIDEIKPCKKMIQDVVDEAADIIRTRLPSML
uniref:Nitronate monooxygenase domain-containing protein n=2 Tax=Aplanochytrium stocchinoi TaxID=215587 RepID=A0A7S3PEB7_9STRA|mmetsp:Transcript_3058/g.3867  ORF Transcript_3058/g.3867 Transcript_3058/m.3867 type:complete len:331 (+) Transcript_3058:132-1124(+)|eukprot:CAMPEP_0204832486 /NCGR_PEP_ID=MMETSP1346-20131115/13831_1 /ASSEMBLY_ACC=CAM_ASM_000771 /TAXON_ID=215587 /ORGANISM="Aplanochytrium stocchinoi, Strain GSBS06" /LENGTH=330 /DNA_ID=CAMNT_0051964323 /DNA_START=88 /DNA_END=1080 /DNA_ORIENTATION=-